MQSIKKTGVFGRGADICSATSDTYLMPLDVILHMTVEVFFSTSLIFLSAEVPDKAHICIHFSALQGHGPELPYFNRTRWYACRSTICFNAALSGPRPDAEVEIPRTWLSYAII